MVQGLYKEGIVIAYREPDIKGIAFPLTVRQSTQETREEALEKAMPIILDYLDKKGGEGDNQPDEQ